MPSNHLILCNPLLLPSIFSSIRVFSNELVLRIRWPKYWSFSFSISPCNEYSELISFRIDWLDLLAVQGTLKRLLQYRYFYIIYSYVKFKNKIKLKKNIYIYINEFKPIPIFPWKQNCVLASLGCHNKITQTRYFLWVLEADKSKIKVSANVVPGENSLSGLQTAIFPAVSSHGLSCAGIPLLIKPPILPD